MAEDHTEQPESRLPGWNSLPQMLFQNEYVAFVFVSALDIMLTWAILRRGGTEVNPIAREVIDAWGFNGAIAFKFALTIFVIIVCEVVGRRRPVTGRWLARFAIFVSALAPIWSIGLLGYDSVTG